MNVLRKILRNVYTRHWVAGKVSDRGNLELMVHNYREWRRGYRKPAALALKLAVMDDTVRLDRSIHIGAPNDKGYRYISILGSSGLRFVNYSDNIVDSIHHTGWFTDVYQDSGSTYRGCVVQVSGRKGLTRYLAAYEEKEAGGYVVDFSKIYETPKSIMPNDLGEHQHMLKEAARRADRMAEHAAEGERDYSYKYQRANRWIELNDCLTGIDCLCRPAEEERDRLRTDIKAIEDEFPDIEQFAKEHF